MLPEQVTMLTVNPQAKEEGDNTIPSGFVKVDGMDVWAVLIALIRTLKADALQELSSKEAEILKSYIISG